MKTIGVVGLGDMGGGVATTLLKKGYRVMGYDISLQRQEQYSAIGIITADPKALGEACEAVLLFLPMAPFDPTLEDFLLRKERLLEYMQPGSILIECGNTSPTLERILAEQALSRGVGFIDAPASGGPQGAINGTLSVMAGGGEEDFQKAHPLLKDISAEVNYFGPVGSGQTAKLINNMIVNGELALLSEVMVFAKKNGLEVDKLLNTLGKGAASSWVLSTYGNGIYERPDRTYQTPGGGFEGKKQGGRDKQLAWAIELGEELEVPLPMTSTAYQMFMMARGMGKGGLFEPIVAMLEDMTHVDVSQSSSEKKLFPMSNK
jgi:3-hydroxyisobutyrate dehydrogenase-like beta-hydroxyacid dehydrogenase